MEIDISHFVKATARDFTTREHEGKTVRVLMASRTYDTTIEDLWDALTNPERIPNWFMPITGDLKLGGRYQLQGNANGEILSCESPTHLYITWEFGGHVSWVDVLLSESPFGTNLRLEHINAVADEMLREYGPGAAGLGWESAMLGIEQHLRTPGPRDFAAVIAWITSPEGKRFMSLVSEAWMEVDIAAGTTRDAARAAADKTRAFYTGEG